MKDAVLAPRIHQTSFRGRVGVLSFNQLDRRPVILQNRSTMAMKADKRAAFDHRSRV